MIYSNSSTISDSPIIAWDDVTNTATLTASSSAEDFPVTGLKNGVTTDPWRPASMPANIEIDCGESKAASVLSFAAHTMGTNGVTVTLEKWDGAAWVDVISAAPETDEPLVMVFNLQEAQEWRVSFTGAIFSVAVMSLCDALHIPNQIEPGHTPFYAAAEIELLGGSVSSNGHYLEPDFYRKGAEIDVTFSRQRPGFILSDEFLSFRDHYNKGRGFFIAMTPLHDPRDVGYVWRTPTPFKSRYISAVQMDATLRLNAYVK